MVLLDSPNVTRGWRKGLVSIWVFFECWFLTGLFYGWSSLVFVLKDEGIYSNLCENDENLDAWSENNNTTVTTRLGATANLDNSTTELGTNRGGGSRECALQDDRMALCFTVASFAYGGLSSVMGYVNYKTGTRITRLISYVMNTAGVLCLAFVTEDVPWLMYPGLSLIAVAGLSLFVTNAQVAHIFRKYNSTYIGILCGALDASSVIFMVIKLAHQNGFARRNMFFILAALHACTLISTFLFLPKGFVTSTKSEPAESYKQEPQPEQDSKEPLQTEIKATSVFKILRQPLFITFVLWLSLLQLRFYYFLGTLNVYLNELMMHDQNKVSYYTDVCFYTLLVGLVTAIGVGAIYDYLKRVFIKKGRSRLYQSVMPAMLPMAGASVMSVLASVLILLEHEPLLYLIFIAFTLKRSFLYSMMVAYVNAVFPSHLFGILFGVAMTTASATSCFQYAFFHWAESYEDGRFHADICLLFISLVTLCHPLYMWFSAIRAERREATCYNLSDKEEEQTKHADGFQNKAASVEEDT